MGMFDEFVGGAPPKQDEVPRITVRPAPSFTPAQRESNVPTFRDFVGGGDTMPGPKGSFESFKPGTFNKPFGEVKNYQRSPTEQVQSWGQDALMAVGADPHVAGRLSKAYTDIARTLTPMGGVLSGADMPFHINRGEYGAALFTRDSYFAIPAYPLESVFDPTGAGDTFAGGFMGYLASQETIDESAMRRAMIFGSVMASFNVEEFGTERVRRLTHAEINDRFHAFKRMTHFDEIPFEAKLS